MFKKQCIFYTVARILNLREYRYPWPLTRIGSKEVGGNERKQEVGLINGFLTTLEPPIGAHRGNKLEINWKFRPACIGVMRMNPFFKNSTVISHFSLEIFTPLNH